MKNTFLAQATNLTSTQNGALTNKSSLNPVVDLFSMGVGFKFEKEIRTAAKEQKDLVIDMTMLSLSSRRGMMTKFPNANFKAIVVIPHLPIVKERASKRLGKEMSDKVYEHMLPTFTMPVKEEGFEEITYILD